MRKGQPCHEAVRAADFQSHSDFHGSGDRDQLPYYGDVRERHVTGGRPDGRDDAGRHGWS